MTVFGLWLQQVGRPWKFLAERELVQISEGILRELPLASQLFAPPPTRATCPGCKLRVGILDGFSGAAPRDVSACEEARRGRQNYSAFRSVLIAASLSKYLLRQIDAALLRSCTQSMLFFSQLQVPIKIRSTWVVTFGMDQLGGGPRKTHSRESPRWDRERIWGWKLKPPRHIDILRTGVQGTITPPWSPSYSAI